MANDDDYDPFDEEAEGEDGMKNHLEPPQIMNYPFALLKDFIERNILDLNPDFQREVVWNAVMKNYYVPPVIFSKHNEYDGIANRKENEFRRAVIDGKQRLTSIYKFMTNQIPHIDSNTKKRTWYSVEGGRNHFTAAERLTFNNKTVICVEYADLEKFQEEEMFSRVQLGMALTTAEKMFAIGGPLTSFIRKLMEDHAEVLSMMEDKRKRVFHILAQAWCIINLDGPEVLPSTTAVTKTLKEKREPEKRQKALMDGILRVLGQTYADYPEIFRKYKTVAPIEFCMFCYMVYRNDESTITQLRDDIDNMRETTRKKEKDIRANQRLYSLMKLIVDNGSSKKGRRRA
ncbi:hypothetical protein HDV00_010403 [Rhizophlyctis rosea]|nr:hypothetical protein HDV00_010403 [Rhizophlyctis rosea]